MDQTKIPILYKVITIDERDSENANIYAYLTIKVYLVHVQLFIHIVVTWILNH